MNIVTARTPEHYQIAIGLFSEYARGLGIDLSFQNFEKELETIPQMYGPPEGELFLIENNGDFTGCAAIRKLNHSTCELKRMYIQPQYRGLKLGKQLMDVALQTAVNLGYEYMKLDSLRRLTPALKLYQKYGFQEIEPYNFNPEDDVVYFERKLKTNA